MKKASELRETLQKAGWPTEALEQMIKGGIERGELEDDLDAAPTIQQLDVGKFDADLEELAKAMSATSDGAEPLSKALSTLDEHGDVMALAEAVTAGSDKLVETTAAGLAALQKGHKLVAGGQSQTLHGLNTVLTVLGGITSELAELRKAVAQPIPPKAKVGAEPAPHPGEQQDPAAEKKTGDKTPQEFAEARDELLSKAFSEFKSTENATRKGQLRALINQAENAGSNPWALAKDASIELSK